MPARKPIFTCDLGGWHVTTESAEVTAMRRDLELKVVRGDASPRTLRRHRQRLLAAERRARDAADAETA